MTRKFKSNNTLDRKLSINNSHNSTPFHYSSQIFNSQLEAMNCEYTGAINNKYITTIQLPSNQIKKLF